MLGQKSIVVNCIWGLVKVEDGQFQENFMVDGRSIKLFTTAVIIILFKSTEVNKINMKSSRPIASKNRRHVTIPPTVFPQNDV